MKKRITKRISALLLASTLGIGTMTQAGEIAAIAAPAKAAPIVTNEDNAVVAYKSRKASRALHAAAEKLPDKFDLRDVNGKNYVTSVKSQAPYNSCWSFGSIAASETSLLYENNCTNEEFKRINGKELNLSEKALAWFTAHKLTPEDVNDIDVPASQVGEGIDVDELEKKDGNAAYNLGGFILYATSLFSSGSGPKSEDYEFPGEENPYPYAYRGKNGWTEYELCTDPSLEDTARSYFLPKYVEEKGSNQGFDEWFNKKRTEMTERGNSEGLLYVDADDWSIPVDYAHRTDTNIATLQESNILPSPAITDPQTGKYLGFDQDGVDAIKKELNAGRAVSIAFHADTATPDKKLDPSKELYINSLSSDATWAHYTCDDAQANHVVCIVGYDDNYSKNNFLSGKSAKGNDKTPPGDGAFIAKNSWGSMNDQSEGKHNTKKWGYEDSGYFYLSYYDKTLCEAESFNYYTTRDPDCPSGIMTYADQYDFLPASWISSMLSSEESSMANVFTAARDQRLAYISTQTGSPGTEVSYEIYALKDGSANPKDGTLLTSGTKTCEYGGYHRIALAKDIPLPKGTRYSVVMTNKVPCDDPSNPYLYEICFFGVTRNAVGFKGDAYQINGVINRGESLFCSDHTWADLTELTEELDKDYKANGMDMTFDNFAIKAYSIPMVQSINTAKVYLKNDTTTYNGKVQKPTVKFIDYYSQALPASAYTMTIKDARGHTVSSPKEAGTYTLIITGRKSAGYSGTAKTTYKIKPADNVLKLNKKTVTGGASFYVKKKNINKKDQSYTVTRSGKGKITMTNKSTAKLRKYLTLKKDRVILKKKAPKGTYKFTLTVAANTNWKKTSSKEISISVK